MYIIELKEWIASKMSKGRKSLSISVGNSKRIQSELISNTKFLDSYYDDVTLTQRVYHIYNDLEFPILCKECNINGCYWEKNKWDYGKYCSKDCYHVNIIKTLESSMMKKHGVKNYAQTDEFKERMISHNLSEHGVKYYMQTDEFKDKSKETCNTLYGVDFYTQTEEFAIRFQETCRLRYGVDFYVQTEDFRFKYRKTCMSRYNRPHPLGLCSQEKEYILPSGKKIYIQGYENHAIDILLKSFNEDELSMGTKSVNESIGHINYTHDGKESNYFPDIYIPSENRIIEVKSNYFYEKDLDKNISKREACEELNYTFEFWIFTVKNKNVRLEIL